MDALFAIGQLDRAVLHAIQANASPLLTVAMLAITFFGSPVFWVGIAAAIYWQGRENRGFFLVNLVVFASAAAGVLKQAFFRPRPSPEEFMVLSSEDYGTASFPSGHAMLSASVFSYYHRLVERHLKAIFGTVVLLVALSRLYLGMHYLSDVVAGLAIGLVIGKLNEISRKRLFHSNFRPSKLEDEIALVGLVAVAVIAVMFLRSIPMSGLFIGFYAGFFLFKEMQLHQSTLLNKMLAIKYAIGFGVLLGVLLVGEGMLSIGISLNEAQRFALYAAGGFWISLLWPAMFEKALKTRKQ